MPHIPITAGMTGLAFRNAINANFIPIDQIENEGIYVYPAGGFASSTAIINAGLTAHNCIKLYGLYYIYGGGIVVPANKTLFLAPGTELVVLDNSDCIRLKTYSRIIGNGSKLSVGVAGYTGSLVRLNPVDNIMYPRIDDLMFMGLADYCGNGISMAHDVGSVATGTITFANFKNLYFNYFNKAINIDMDTGFGWINCSIITNVFVSGSVNGIYMANGGYINSTVNGREIRNNVITDLMYQASARTQKCAYLDCLESELKMRTLDTPWGAFAVYIPSDGVNNQIISDTLNPIYDGGLYNAIHSNILTNTCETQFSAYGPYHRYNANIWLDANYGITGNPVSVWKNKMPISNDLIELVNKPAWIPVAINGLPVLRPAGSELLTFTAPITLSRFSFDIFIVMKLNALDATDRCLFGDVDKLYFNNTAGGTIKMIPNGGAPWIDVAVAGLGIVNYFILEICNHPTILGNVISYIDNSFIDNKAVGLNFTLNKLFTPSFMGDVAEMMIYYTKRSTDERLYDYLQLKAKYAL